MQNYNEIGGKKLRGENGGGTKRPLKRERDIFENPPLVTLDNMRPWIIFENQSQHLMIIWHNLNTYSYLTIFQFPL